MLSEPVNNVKQILDEVTKNVLVSKDALVSFVGSRENGEGLILV